MKIVVDKADTRGYFDHVWLKTHHTFSSLIIITTTV